MSDQGIWYSENKTGVETLTQGGLWRVDTKLHAGLGRKNFSKKVTFELNLDNKMSSCMKNQSNMNIRVYNLFGPNPAIGSVVDHSGSTGSKTRTSPSHDCGD